MSSAIWLIMERRRVSRRTTSLSRSRRLRAGRFVSAPMLPAGARRPSPQGGALVAELLLAGLQYGASLGRDGQALLQLADAVGQALPVGGGGGGAAGALCHPLAHLRP